MPLRVRATLADFARTLRPMTDRAETLSSLLALAGRFVEACEAAADAVICISNCAEAYIQQQEVIHNLLDISDESVAAESLRSCIRQALAELERNPTQARVILHDALRHSSAPPPPSC